MPRKPRTAGPSGVPQSIAKLTGHQIFVTERLLRSTIDGVSWNPRVISDEERAKLETILTELGLAEPLVVTRRSVAKGWPAGARKAFAGGHQRISILDALEGTADYLVDFAVIDVDAKKERAINLALNHRGAQGRWDLTKFAAILVGEDGVPGVDYASAGFAPAELKGLFADTPFAETDFFKGLDGTPASSTLMPSGRTDLVKTVQLFLSPDQHEAFNALSRELAGIFKTTNITTTILEAMKRARAGEP